jgi:hypothetical protein
MSRARATLHLPGGGTVSGELVSISHESAELSFASAELQETVGDDLVQLSIAASGVHLNLNVRVFGWSEEGELRRCRVQLANLGAVESRNVRRLIRGYNQRQAFRIDIDPSYPVGVIVESLSDGSKSSHDLVDISGLGLAVKTQPLGRLQLRKGSRVKLRFELDGFPGLVELIGEVQNIDKAGDDFRYGVSYDATETHDFNMIQDLIVDYVMACERRSLRGTA